MTRFMPHPLIAAFLFAIWLVLNQSVSPGNILLGMLFAYIGAWTITAIEPPKVSVRSPGAILKLAALVIFDIMRSNIAVARIITGLAKPAKSGFVRIPLDLQNSGGLAILAIIITSTPGTVWVDFDSREKLLTIHVLDLVDEEGWIRTVKKRYERFLLEIFE
jgi:multicomponent K+:H+ antiporter subunit E